MKKSVQLFLAAACAALCLGGCKEKNTTHSTDEEVKLAAMSLSENQLRYGDETYDLTPVASCHAGGKLYIIEATDGTVSINLETRESNIGRKIDLASTGTDYDYSFLFTTTLNDMPFTLGIECHNGVYSSSNGIESSANNPFKKGEMTVSATQGADCRLTINSRMSDGKVLQALLAIKADSVRQY